MTTIRQMAVNAASEIDSDQGCEMAKWVLPQEMANIIEHAFRATEIGACIGGMEQKIKALERDVKAGECEADNLRAQIAQAHVKIRELISENKSLRGDAT